MREELEFDMNRSDAVGGVLIFCFGMLTAYLSMRMPLGSFRLPGPGMFPLSLAVLLMGLSAIYTVRAVLRARGMAVTDKKAFGTATSIKRVAGFVGIIAAATALLGGLGYATTAFLLIFSLLYWLGLKGWRRNVLIALSASVFSHFLFVAWLKIPFPRGWFGI